MHELREEARAAVRALPFSLIGSDTDVQALEAARANAELAGLKLNLRLAPLAQAVPSAEQGGFVSNPPYGERLARSASLGDELTRALGRFDSYQRALVVPRHFGLGLAADRFLLVYNGAIECELRRYDAIAP
jgi:23S rRNA G2445 N2-methylase RlmL